MKILRAGRPKPRNQMQFRRDQRSMDGLAKKAERKNPELIRANEQSATGMIWQLKLIGVHASKYLKLMEVLKEAARRLQGMTVVQQVSDIDSIISSKVSATPALMLDDEVLVENAVPEVEQLTRLLQAAIDRKRQPEKTMRILVPVDFSDAARNALHYALKWAAEYGLDVEVVHAFASTLADPAQPYFVPVQEEEQRAMEQRLATFVEEVRSPELEQIKVRTQAIAGYPVETITELSKDPSVALIIMATTGEHDLLEKMFGSVSTAVSRMAWAPVLLVPPGVTFERYRNIVYATNLEATDRQMIRQVVALAHFFRANIHFVHVVTDPEQAEAVEDAVFAQIFEGEQLPPVAFHLVGIRDDKPWEALSRYAREHKADLLITVTRHRSFWERMMHKSVTKRLALGTTIPMLVLHLDSQKDEKGVWLPQKSGSEDTKEQA